MRSGRRLRRKGSWRPPGPACHASIAPLTGRDGGAAAWFRTAGRPVLLPYPQLRCAYRQHAAPAWL